MPVSQTILLRPARIADRGPAINIQLEAYEPLTRAAWGRWDADQMRAGMTAEWKPEQTRCIVLDGVLIGFVRLEQRLAYDWLDLIVIAVAAQGAGLGRRVLGQLQREAAERGVPLWLSVYRINAARRLYAAMGFSEHDRDPVRVLMGHPADAPPPPALLAPGPDRRSTAPS